jgi:hypothetical protein
MLESDDCACIILTTFKCMQEFTTDEKCVSVYDMFISLLFNQMSLEKALINGKSLQYWRIVMLETYAFDTLDMQKKAKILTDLFYNAAVTQNTL